MSGSVSGHTGTHHDETTVLVASLRAQCPRLYETIQEHVREAVAGPHGDDDVEYEAGQYAAVVAAVDYGLTALEHGEDWSGPIPPATKAQAQRAARQGVPLDAVLRRYHAGQAKLANVITKEIDRSHRLGHVNAVRLIVGLHALHNHLTAEIAVEYEREILRVARSPEQHRAERVQRLLGGTSFDTSGMGYEFDDAWHICVIAVGARAERTVGALAAGLNRRLLSVPRSDEIVWAWLGGPRYIAAAELENVPLGTTTSGVALALSEPGRGLDGWRMTHRQAQAALRVTLLEPQTLTRYADVAFIEPFVRDRALAQSFIDIRLSPLNALRDGGAEARETLRAYFEAGHRVEAAAAALNVDRSTLRKRLATIERQLGYALPKRQAELEAALLLEALYAAQPSGGRLQFARRLGGPIA